MDKCQESKSPLQKELCLTKKAPVVPGLQTVHEHECQTASLCTSSAASVPYGSPRESENEGSALEIALQREWLLGNPASAANGDLQFSKSGGGSNEQTLDRQIGVGQNTLAAPPLSYIAASATQQVHNDSDIARASSHATALGSSLTTLSLSPLSQLPPPPPRTYFQYIHSFEYRCRLSAKMHILYGAATIPVIVEPAESRLRIATSAASSSLRQQRPYESERIAAGTPRCSSGIGHKIFAYLGVHEAHLRGSSSNPTTGTTSVPVLSASAVSALGSPSTRSTLKCVLPSSKSVAEVILTLRDRLALGSCQSIFLSVGESDALVPGNSLLGDLYRRYRNRDGFLYLSYMLENTFG